MSCCFRWMSLALIACRAGSLSAAETPPDFNRDVRPILSQYCFKCHGPDETKREAGVRLDLRETAVGASDSGAQIVVPGRPEQSELIRRVESTSPDEVMPPPATNFQLTPTQKQILRAWIVAGADYQPHWAYLTPKRPNVPAVTTGRVNNPIDAFVLAKLQSANAERRNPNADLVQSPEADRYTLIRRVTLDLLGVPPSRQDAEQFVNDPAPDAYERLVDRLLASPQYGERWARRWLDLARYADTNGYEKDRPRTIWPYRDWVIDALNADLPFDQFTIEQLAGDMLPNATPAQRIATGFHRNTMLNEEGGIDPLEFRFYAMTDRVNTTATVWMGLTLGCAQCHTHKYDPIRQTDYYRLMAYLNNADEPEFDVPNEAVFERRAALEAEIAAREAELPQQFPPPSEWRRFVGKVLEARSAGEAVLIADADGAVLVTGKKPKTDRYDVVLEIPEGEYHGLQLEALTDPSLGNGGPGRAPHGNFVLSELTLELMAADGARQPVKLASAVADAAQDGFPPQNVLDGDLKTGWAIHVGGNWNVPRTLTVTFAMPLKLESPARCAVTLYQEHGTVHTLGKFRLSVGHHEVSDEPEEVRRQKQFDAKFEAWLTAHAPGAVPWIPIVPQRWTTTLPKLERLSDGSLLASGDQSKRDVYELIFGPELSGATAIRIEALPDDRLPKHGPGRVYYEGPQGDFFLSEVQWEAGEQRLPWGAAAHSFASGNLTASAAIDGNPLTGWSINGGQGRAHVAVLQLAEPAPQAAAHTLRLIFERYYAAGLGRFRLSYTTAARPADAPALMPEVETALITPETSRTQEQQQLLVQTFCQTTPELEPARKAIAQLRAKLPTVPATLVFQERPSDNPRPTYVHRRGEFLQPQETVEPGVPAFLPQPNGHDRLAFARWLVDPRHPLTGRVTVNRHWQAFFGRGLVRTLEDFGYQGELPTHPELLDWLAVELVEGRGARVESQRDSDRSTHPTSSQLSTFNSQPSRAWSIKALHRLIVTSATYRQSSRVTPLLLERDPQNQLLARGPRLRLEAETVRDVLLSLSGLLSTKMHGPSVFPPQPANVTTEGAYGRLDWAVSPGEDRYRRGLYTFTKRTAPYAMFTTFDGPSGEACVPRREVSNTPLQALTLLNDAVFLEAAQALGREWAAREGALPSQLRDLFQQCLTRPPSDAELALLMQFHQRQHKRLSSGELSAPAIAGGDEHALERAAWTLTARALLNLDETITRE